MPVGAIGTFISSEIFGAVVIGGDTGGKKSLVFGVVTDFLMVVYPAEFRSVFAESFHGKYYSIVWKNRK